MANKPLDRVPIDGRKLLKLIKKNGFNLEELGNDPNVNRSAHTIRRYAASNSMSRTLIQDICRVTKIEASEFVMI